MNLDPRKLAVLLAVARSGSFSGAARALGLSQPGISAAIQQLERATGTILLERGRQGAVPTQAGRLLIKRAEAIDQVLGYAAAEIALHGRGAAGMLVVGGTPGALMSLVPPAIRTLRATLPGLQLIVQEAHDRELVTLLREMKIDLALSTVGLEAPPDDIVETAIARDVFEVVVASGHPLGVEAVSLHDLASHPWVLPAARGAFRRHLDALFLASEVRLPDDVVLCDSLTTTKEIIRQTDYVTILPRNVVAAEVASGALRTITLNGQAVTRSIGVRRMGGVAPSPAAEAFIAGLRSAFAAADDP